MSRRIRETVSTVREQGNDKLKTALEFITRFSTAAQKGGTVDEILSDLGFVNDNAESETSSFSFNMDTATGVSFSSSVVAQKSGRVSFSSHLAHRCLRDASDESGEDVFAPWIGDAVVMFVDLSGYSKITSILATKGGAHALSAAVNGVFSSILDVVERFGGDVITFAGDAICVCWPCVDASGNEVCVLAAACALELQRKCGTFPVEGTDLAFRLHIGITFGEIESHILFCHRTANMQGAYHYVCGTPLSETALVVDAAKNGEICVTSHVFDFLRKVAVCDERVVDESKVFLLKELEDEVNEILDKSPFPTLPTRSKVLEAKLVPPIVARKLRQGFKESHLSEMRFLCVLFVRQQLDSVSTSEWFSEVQAVLDECRCPIVQLMHDDKGTHLIACVNLFRTERDPTSSAIRAARTLVERETGCAIGIACGQVFCGVTGAEQAGRWDITGPACVRACRLMQHSAAEGINVVIDETIYAHVEDVSQLERLPNKISVKGSAEPVTIYTLSSTTMEVTCGIIQTSWTSPTLNAEQRNQLTMHLNSQIQRGVSLVSGPLGSGKKTCVILALQAAQYSSITHFTSTETRPLCAFDTFAQWIASYHDPRLSELGKQLSSAIQATKLTKSLSTLHGIVNEVVKQGLKLCYVIAYATLLDSASLSAVKSILGSNPTEGEGKFHVVLSAYPLYNTRSIESLDHELKRQADENNRLASRHNVLRVQVDNVHVKIPYAKTASEFGEAFASSAFFHLRPRAAEVLLEATGGCLLFIRPLLYFMGTATFRLDAKSEKSGRTDLMPSYVDGTLDVTARGIDFLMQEIAWPQVAPAATSRFTELYDVLSPRLQLLLRVVASVSTTTGSVSPHHVANIMKKLNSKISFETVEADIEELKTLEILKAVDVDGGELSFAVPAMIDVVTGLLTPDQDRVLKRHAFRLVLERYDEIIVGMDAAHLPVWNSFVARLGMAAGDVAAYKKYLSLSWQSCQSDGIPPSVVERMEERLHVEHRRHPTICNESLFSPSRLPLLSRFTSTQVETDEKTESMPQIMRFLATSFYPPMALGGISGEIQKVGWRCQLAILDQSNPSENFLPPEYRTYLDVNVGHFMAAVERFEATIPQLSQEQLPEFPPQGPPESESLEVLGHVLPLSLDEEKKLLESIVAVPGSLRKALDQAVMLLHYYYKILIPRRNRIVAYVRTLDSIDKVQCQAMRSDSTCVLRAFRLLLHPHPIPSVKVHEALLELATGGWQSKYYHVNLQRIREQVFKWERATIDDFKAFLLALKMFGEEISPAQIYTVQTKQ